MDAWIAERYLRGMSGVLPIATVIVSGILYHLAQKASGASTPWPMLAVAYGTAFAMTIALAFASRDAGRWEPDRGDWIAGLLIGVAAFGIEASFYFIYRAGWPLSSASVIANVAVTGILALVGILVFGEHLSVARAAGLALAAGGATLIARG